VYTSQVDVSSLHSNGHGHQLNILVEILHPHPKILLKGSQKSSLYVWASVESTTANRIATDWNQRGPSILLSIYVCTKGDILPSSRHCLFRPLLINGLTQTHHFHQSINIDRPVCNVLDLPHSVPYQVPRPLLHLPLLTLTHLSLYVGSTLIMNILA